MVPAQGFLLFQASAAKIAALSDNARDVTQVTSAKTDIFQLAVGQLRQGRARAADVIPRADCFNHMRERSAKAAVMRPGCDDNSHNNFPSTALNLGRSCMTCRYWAWVFPTSYRFRIVPMQTAHAISGRARAVPLRIALGLCSRFVLMLAQIKTKRQGGANAGNRD